MMVRGGLGLVMALSIAGAAAGQESVAPSWASVPGPHDMAEVYPMFASMADIGANVTLSCILRPDGVLSLCRIVRAAPEGLGFEAAALRMTPAFLGHPRQVDGDPTKSQVQFTVRFRLPDDEIPRWTEAEPTPEHVAAARAFLAALPAVEEARGRVQTMDLQVSPDRESKVRAMVVQVNAEFEARFLDAEALAMARLISPEALAALIKRRAPPPLPSEAAMIKANDVFEQLSMESMLRLRALYCTQFDCDDIPSSRIGQ